MQGANSPAVSAPAPPVTVGASSTAKKVPPGKTKELKKRIQDLEQDNEKLLLKIGRVRKNIYRLRLEKKFLLERFQHQQAQAQPQAQPKVTEISATSNNGNSAGEATDTLLAGAFNVYCQANKNVHKAVIEAQWRSLPELEKAASKNDISKSKN